MTVTPTLGDSWCRFDWAQDDCEALNGLQRAFRDSGTYSTWVQPESDRRHVIFRLMVDPATERQRLNPLARLFGTALDHGRATLNYLTYQLAQIALIEDPTLQLRPEAVEFPIFNDADSFRINNRVKKLPDKYRDRLEEVQPYDGKNQGLWMLHELAREFRHRLIHPMAVFPVGDYHGIFRDPIDGSIGDVDIWYQGGALKDGDKLFSFTVSDDFQPDMTPPIQIAIGVDHPLCENTTMNDVLQAIMDDIVTVMVGWIADFPDPAPDWVVHWDALKGPAHDAPP